MSDLDRLSNIVLISRSSPPVSSADACSTAELIEHRRRLRAIVIADQTIDDDAPLGLLASRRPARSPLLRVGGAVLFVVCVITLGALVAMLGIAGR